MDRGELHRLLTQRPFRPFRMVLTDGRSFEVRYPAMNQLGSWFIKVGIPEPTGPDPICDHAEFVRLAEIARVEPLADSATVAS